MKKLVLTSCLIAVSLLSYAGENTILRNSRTTAKSFISNGLYLNIGLGFPTMGSKSAGVLPNIEVGSHFLFMKREKVGVGMKVGYFNMGISAYSETYYNGGFFGVATNDVLNLDLKILKVGPMASFAFTEQLGLDVYVDVCPTIVYGIGTEDANIAGGVLVSPGAKFRWRFVTAGVDFTVGSLKNYENSDEEYNQPGGYVNSYSYFMPRVYAGFKF